jgi:citrate lyase beta subunit
LKDKNRVASFGDEFRLTLITNDPVLAAKGDSSGVDRIGVDLEQLGKAERQAGQNSRLSGHRTEDLTVIAGSLRRAKLFARVNPINPDTSAEVEAVLSRGAKVLMLPYFRTAGEVETFVRLVDGRAYVIILVETGAAVVRIREILAVPGVQEVMVGLNDLRLDLGVQNHFEVLVSPLMDTIASEVRKTTLALSVGGVARVDDPSLPVAPDLILAQFARLGATGAWISRSFFDSVPPDWDFGKAISSVRERLSGWASASPEAWERARDELAEAARGWR